MDIKKAICTLKAMKVLYNPVSEKNDALEVAISAMQELQEYRQIGTVEECREAREKQEPTEPIKSIRGIYPSMCVNCKRPLKFKQKFCDRCGQAIKWESEE